MTTREQFLSDLALVAAGKLRCLAERADHLPIFLSAGESREQLNQFRREVEVVAADLEQANVAT